MFLREQKLAVSKCTRMYICWQGIYTVYFKRLTANGISERTWMSVVISSSEFACELVAQECTRMYILGRGCPWFHATATFLLRKNSPSMRPWRDGVLISSEFCARAQNSSFSDIHGCMSEKVYTDVHFWTGYFKRLTAEVFQYRQGQRGCHAVARFGLCTNLVHPWTFWNLLCTPAFAFSL